MKKLAMMAMGLMLMCAAQSVRAQQVLAAWQTGGADSTVTPALTVSSNAAKVAASTLTAGGGLTAFTTANLWAWSGWPVTSVAGSTAYLSVTLTPAANCLMTVTNLAINMDYVLGTHGPTNWTVRTSVDNYASDAGAFGSVRSVTETLYQCPVTGVANQSQAVTIRLYGFNNADSASRRCGIGHAGPAKGDFYIEGSIENTVNPGSVVIIK